MINVMYALNKKVYNMMLISAVSVANHASEPVHFYLLTMDLHEENPKYVPIEEHERKFLEDILKKKNPLNEVTVIDCLEAYHSFEFNDVNNMKIFTPYANLRLFADKLNLPDHIIYLDVDTICNSDIKELFDLPIDDYEVLAVRDVFIWGLKNHKKYFNSGMLNLNLKKIRETGYFQKARELCNKKHMTFLDQDALNFTWTSMKLIDRKFNRIHRGFRKFNDNVIHHMCDCRAYFVYRYKSSNLNMVRKHMKCYRPLIDECEKYIEEFKKINK